MANAVWPVSLPQAMLIGFQRAEVSEVVRTSMEEGPLQSRPLSTINAERYSGSVFLSDAQRDTFDAFYRSTLAQGSLPFDWRDPFTGDPATFKFLADPSMSASTGRGQHCTLQLEAQP